jgi:hypothetical protein
MWPLPNPLDLFGDAIGEVTGWAWDKVIQGIYTWFANGLLLLMEWVWNVLDTRHHAPAHGGMVHRTACCGHSPASRSGSRWR